MARQPIFTVDTVLYHPIEGSLTFPRGEQNPGPAWFDTPECVPESSDAVDLMTADLKKARDEISRLALLVGAREHDAAQSARLAAEAGRERDEALAENERLRQGFAPLDHDGDGAPGGSRKADDDPEADEKVTLRAQLAGRGIKPHHKTGLAHLRELLAESET